MTTKNRPITEQAAPKLDTPKRIIKNARPARSLPFDRTDKRLLVKHLRWEFSKSFSCGFSMDFQDGEESLRLTTHRRLTPESARGALNKLGVNPKLIEDAVQSIKVRFGKHTPKLEQLAFDSWFHILSQESFGEKFSTILAPTPESRAKWEKRLKQYGLSWKDIGCSGGAVIDITKDLLKSILGQEVTKDAIGRRYYRWKMRENRLLHGLVGKTYTARWDILESDP